MAFEKKEREILSTWKEISAYLGYEARTCQRWEKEAGLPVYRFLDSSKSSVFAYKHELDKWIEAKTQKKSKNKWKYLYLLIPAAALVLIYFVFITPLFFSQPHDFRIEGSELIILNDNNRPIWRYDTGISNLEDEEFYRSHFQVKRPSPNNIYTYHPLLIIKDINKDGQNEVLFATRQIQSHHKGGSLLCFNHRGRIKWPFDPGQEMVFGEKIYSSEYQIEGIGAVDINNDGLLEISVISCNIFMFPSKLSVLDSKGQLLREYWNSGRIKEFFSYDLDDDGGKEFILAGCNNEYDKGFLAVLEPDFKTGSSPQTGYYKSPDLKQGIEKYYLLFPNTTVDENEYRYGNIVQAKIISNKTISAETKSGIYYEFDFNFRLKEIRFTDRYEDLHNEAHQEGITQERFSPKVMAKLKSELRPKILYFTGKNWSDTPLMAQKNPPLKKQ